MTTETIAELVESSDKLTETIIGKVAEIKDEVELSRAAHEQFMTDSDSRYQKQLRHSQSLRVDGDQNYWYPVRIDNPDGASLSISRGVHDDAATYGSWNGAFQFDFRVKDSHYGSVANYFLVDLYIITGKSTSRLLPDSDIPYIGKISVGHGPYDCFVWLRGNTTYRFSSDNAVNNPTVHYEEFVSVSGYGNAAPIPVTDGVNAGVPEIGYVRGQ